MKEYTSKVILEVTSSGQYLGLIASHWDETVSKHKEEKKSLTLPQNHVEGERTLERTY